MLLGFLKSQIMFIMSTKYISFGKVFRMIQAHIMGEKVTNVRFNLPKFIFLQTHTHAFDDR